MLGPEHELSIVDTNLAPLPIADKVIKEYCGKIKNFVELPNFTFGKELQLHVMEIKANEPFRSPTTFEETMQQAVETLSDFLLRKFGAYLLGTGMHPLLRLEQTAVWSHRHRKIYESYAKVFNLKQHGWLNIQSFHLNLPFQREKDGIRIHNLLSGVCPYLPAISASSPIYEGVFGDSVDNRLNFYKANQRQVPSVSGEVVPEYASSFENYKTEIIAGYSRDLKAAGAAEDILGREWINSRGVIFRFDRSALEVRVMDEQECVKSDVALACFIRALLRGLLSDETKLLPNEVLVADYNSVVARGLDAQVKNPNGPSARDVCRHLLRVAEKNAQKEEKRYLPTVKKRIENGNLSDAIKRDVMEKAKAMSFKDATVAVYSKLIKCLAANQPYF